ncbi:RNA-guided endonuclease TnpB family protein [Caldanaerobacter subterraneus]|uniref:IS200/IS605 family element transposase accessory protein TnpB n=1 Tax=Caldanaerobacter subterraneus TaxID=911092 RepID=A0A7Y2L8S3_9THEO|nr:RNA-guided endonuclease TnpB family protein [Caldanaerobacter subterraneus]NNG67772.1 IS200/IS605 family element transposase accessory protein TnpB [Caldanaerobacter subterraneus]
MLKAYKYRIYPTEEQKESFEKTFGCCRFVWNKMLEEKLEALKHGRKIPRITPARYKKEYPFLKEVDSLALANVQLQQEKAFRDYFKNPKYFRIPKFKKKKDKQSYTTNNQQPKNGRETIRVDFEKELLYLPKIKSGIKAVFHRRFEGKIKSATVVKTKAGRYYVSILVDVQDPKNDIKESKNFVCGIDLGLKSFVTIVNDTGTLKVEYPKYLIKAEKKLKRLQRQLSKKKKGSKNWEKARKRLAKEYEYVKNAREDFLHKLSKAIIDDNQVVVVESLNVKGLSKGNLAKYILDSSWSKFLGYLSYKAGWYGRTVVAVDRTFPSSKICSRCGYIYRELKLSERVWECPVCGTVHDRDENAAKNLRNYGVVYINNQ